MTHPVYIVVAVDEKWGIGKDGKLPWRLHKEIKYFKDLTVKTEDPDKLNIVIMGRTTWESIPKKFRPLPGRKNIILTRNKEYQAKDAFIAHTLNDALSMTDENIEKIFIIGGAQVFKKSLTHHRLSGIYLTKIAHSYNCDTFFPNIPEKFSERRNLGSDSESDIAFDYLFLGK